MKQILCEYHSHLLVLEIPINPEVGKQGDLGSPIVQSKPDHEISKIYLEFATKIKSTYL